MNLHDQLAARDQLLKIFSQALRRVNGKHCVATYLREHPVTDAHLRVVAIGKAAASMLVGAQAVCGERIEAALVISKYHHIDTSLSRDPSVTAIEAGHPYPDENSLVAGRALLAFLSQTRPGDRLLFLVSGGASALVEVLPDGVGLQQLIEMNRWLLASGWPIDHVNQLRKAVSCVKGGRLAPYLGDYPVTQLLISDVPADDPVVIGSGMLVAQPPAQPWPQALPGWIEDMLAKAPPMPTPQASCFKRIETFLVATNHLLCEQASRLGTDMGLPVRYNERLTGEAAGQGKAIAARLRHGEPGLYIWGGETVVTLPPAPGRGGRCQHLALAAASELDGCENIVLLAAGSDGTDGPGDVAGALIDAGTLQRGLDAGLDPKQALARADAGSFLQASGDLLDTGPTGTNVMDLVLGLKL